MAGSRFGPKSFGHSGFTGTSMWFDPDAGIWAVILTNWVYPKRGNPNIEGIRAKIHDLIFAALR